MATLRPPPGPPAPRPKGMPPALHVAEAEARLEFWNAATALVKKITEAIDIIIEQEREG